MAQGLVDEPTEKNGSRLAEEHRPDKVAEDIPYDLQGRWRVSHNPHVEGARGMAPLILSRYTIVSALGKGLAETFRALRNRRSGLRPCDFEDVGIATYIGRVDDVGEDGMGLIRDIRAILALLLCRMDLDIIALIGIILLIGIVKKNAIMMIDFAIEAQRKENKAPEDAIFQACLTRFRPIMMTTMAALLGAIPLAIDVGEGAELRQPLGIAIVGGLIVSQLLTLYTTPVIYLAFDRLARRGLHAVPPDSKS